MKRNTLYDPRSTIVRKDEDLFLLDTFYNQDDDKLYILYKNATTGLKLVDEIVNPEVPVFFARKNQSKHLETIPLNETFRDYVGYRFRNRDLLQKLNLGKTVCFRDNETKELIEKYIPPKVPMASAQLSPNLYMSDLKICDIVYLEYMNMRYGYDEKSDIYVDQFPVVSLHRAGFDIETDELDPNGRTVNVITYVDDKFKVIFGGYVKDPKYKHQEEVEKEDHFKNVFIKSFTDMVDGISKGKSTDKIKKLCMNMLNEYTLVIKPFNTERELIEYSLDMIYNTYKPDLLSAFNAGFDFSVLYNRAKELDIPLSIFNTKTHPNYNSPPPFNFERDSIDPVARTINIDSYSETHNVCSQAIHYKLRAQDEYPKKSLDATAERILGVGKFDYSHLCNSIIRLPYVHFFYHMVYALIDSMLLILIDDITQDMSTYLQTMLAFKVSKENFHRSSSAVPQAFKAEALRYGEVYGNNLNRVLLKSSDEDLEIVGKMFNQPLVAMKRAILESGTIGGGMVLNPNNITSRMTSFKPYHESIVLKASRRFGTSAYLDFKSLYPSVMITLNIAKETFVGYVDAIINNGKVLISCNKEDRFKKGVKYESNLGKVLLSVINQNITAIGNAFFNLPSMQELVEKRYKKDNPIYRGPNILHTIDSVSYPPRFTSLVKAYNKKKIPKVEITQTDEINDKGYFMFVDSSKEISYYGTHVKIINNNPYNEISETYGTDHLYWTFSKKERHIDNRLVTRPSSNPLDTRGEMIASGTLNLQTLTDILNTDELVYKLKLPTGNTINLNDRVLYYPTKYAVKGKHKELGDLSYKVYRTKESKVDMIVFEHKIIYPSMIDYTIEQTMLFVKLEQ
ncbi:MAG: DNA polymerase domain-containing protein [Paraclostridium sp.]